MPPSLRTRFLTFVDNLCNGLSHDGSQPWPHAIPFTKAPGARRAVARLLFDLLMMAEHAVKPEDMSPLFAKVLIHLCKTGTQSPEAISTFAETHLPTLAEAIISRPAFIQQTLSLTAILRQHHQTVARELAALNIAPDPPHRPVLWTQPPIP